MLEEMLGSRYLSGKGIGNTIISSTNVPTQKTYEYLGDSVRGKTLEAFISDG